MNIYQAERLAQENNSAKEFIASFPAGPTRCKWLDPYMGLFTIEGHEGFVMVSDIDDAFPGLSVIYEYDESA